MQLGERSTGETVPRMRRKGSAARGDVVALTEDDCVVDAQWCGAVIRAHREPWVAVGGAVEPGPYTRASDWAVYFFEYGRFMLPFDQRESSVLPGNNVSDKRRALAEKGLVETEGFHDVFVHQPGIGRVADGDHAGSAVTNRNAWPRSYLTVNPFHHGRGFAARRVAGQSCASRYVGFAGTIVAYRAGLSDRPTDRSEGKTDCSTGAGHPLVCRVRAQLGCRRARRLCLRTGTKRSALALNVGYGSVVHSVIL
jgi:hypothetical protein